MSFYDTKLGMPSPSSGEVRGSVFVFIKSLDFKNEVKLTTGVRQKPRSHFKSASFIWKTLEFEQIQENIDGVPPAGFRELERFL